MQAESIISKDLMEFGGFSAEDLGNFQKQTPEEQKESCLKFLPSIN